jgi:hypothetical protein
MADLTTGGFDGLRERLQQVPILTRGLWIYGVLGLTLDPAFHPVVFAAGVIVAGFLVWWLRRWAFEVYGFAICSALVYLWALEGPGVEPPQVWPWKVFLGVPIFGAILHFTRGDES